MKITLSKIFPIILIIIFSCSKVDEVKNNAVTKIKNKTTETSEKVWKKGVEKVFEFTTIIKPIKFEDIYGKNTGIETNNEVGKRIEFAGNFYQCFLKYNYNKEKILEFLDNLKTNHPEISDEKHSKTDKQMLEEKLKFLESKFPDIYEEISFFTAVKNNKNLEYYYINKYPNSNIIIYDKSDNLIYHFVENYRA